MSRDTRPKSAATGRFLLGIPLLLASLSSCFYASPAKELPLNVELPKAFGGAQNAEPSGGAWWKSFHDSSLEAALEEALRQNRNLAASAERIQAAAAAARIAGADRLPTLGAGLSAQRNKQVFVGFPIPGGGNVLSTRSTSYGLSLDLSWEIDLWGRLSAQEKSALSQLRATELDYHAARLSILAQTAKAWLATREAGAQLSLAERRVQSYERSRAIIEERYRKGLGPALDLRLGEAQLASARATLETRKRLLSQARRSLELLLGRYPKESIEAGDTLPDLPPAVPAGVPAELLDRRPDLRAARERLLAQRYDISTAKASLYPRLSLTSSVGTRSDQLQDLLDGDFSVWSILGNLIQPIFQGGRLRANVRLEESKLREATLQFADLLLRACGEVEGALRDEAQLRNELRAQGALLTSTQEAYELARQRYAQGSVDVLTLLDTERRLFDIESGLLGTRRLALSTRIDLHLALGGDFTTLEAARREDRNARKENG